MERMEGRGGWQIFSVAKSHHDGLQSSERAGKRKGRFGGEEKAKPLLWLVPSKIKR